MAFPKDTRVTGATNTSRFRVNRVFSPIPAAPVRAEALLFLGARFPALSVGLSGGWYPARSLIRASDEPVSNEQGGRLLHHAVKPSENADFRRRYPAIV